MFTIQYVHPVTRANAMQTLDTRNRSKLLQHLARFNHEILAVYEQSTPVTKRTRQQLAEASFRGEVALNTIAAAFISSHP